MWFDGQEDNYYPVQDIWASIVKWNVMPGVLLPHQMPEEFPRLYVSALSDLRVAPLSARAVRMLDWVLTGKILNRMRGKEPNFARPGGLPPELTLANLAWASLFS